MRKRENATEFFAQVRFEAPQLLREGEGDGGPRQQGRQERDPLQVEVPEARGGRRRSPRQICVLR